MSRQPYTEAEDEAMVKFWENELKSHNEMAQDPCGLRLWELYIDNTGGTNRSKDSLASHFRKQILPRLPRWKMSACRKLELFRLYRIQLDDTVQRDLEKGCNVEIKLGSNRNLKSWTKKKQPEHEARSSKAAVNMQPVKQEVPKKDGSKKTSQDVVIEESSSEDEPEKERACSSSTLESIPDPMEFDLTRELDCLKKQKYVNPDTREALGLPPITTPPIEREKRRKALVDDDDVFEPARNDTDTDSRHNMEFDPDEAFHPMMDEGQGAEIGTIDGFSDEISPLLAHRAAASSVTQEFRDEALRTCFRQLTHVYNFISDDLYPEFEKSLNVEGLSKQEYLEEVVKAAEQFVQRVRTISTTSTATTESVQLCATTASSISTRTRTEIVAAIWREFKNTAPPAHLPVIKKALEEMELPICITSSIEEHYKTAMMKLRGEIRMDLDRHLA